MWHGLADLPPRVKARTAGLFYLCTFAGGILALVVHSRIGGVAGLVAAVSYVAVTVIFYDLLLGGLMILAGLGWLTFFSMPLVEAWFPYTLAPGIVGEGALTLWLLLVGVDVRRWHEQADTARLRTRTA
jgi:hypothetical protein